MKKIILFDFDGTLADTLQLALKIVNKYLRNEGYDPISQADLKDLRNMNFLQLIAHFKFPIWKIPTLAKKIKEDLYKEVDKIPIFPGIVELVKGLKQRGFHLAVLSSDLKQTIDKFLELHKIALFDHIQCEPDILGKAKLIKRFLNRHSLATKDVIYIGDEVRDIEACRSVGIQIISVTWGFNDADSLHELKPDFLVKKPAEILGLVKKI